MGTQAAYQGIRRFKLMQDRRIYEARKWKLRWRTIARQPFYLLHFISRRLLLSRNFRIWGP